ncbi:gluconate 2-dehydrogenase subunit 3 family protein [Sphingomonas cannabina]|uniref:gluconate 2-dehydrogenase subunit 3 family protein n=1 Tax=Sphingomonas cannabina TaxID=2899123 RepID=UPI001F309272|nr:gluconate 2-dehydrogenase subunit 3 family protein [Sphingomonas cannabina]UIJ44173.1 gluconate 2-dehydrogenase subunit 3 family protein [Sphingomonas cannabina]
MSGKPTADRRTLLKLAGFGVGMAAAPFAEAQETHAGHDMPAQGTSGAPPAGAAPSPGYIFLNPDEAAFVEAFVDTLIPQDEFTARGTELGVALFVDRQLYSAWGNGERMYLQGPFREGTPEQGYQLRLTPNQLVRAGIADVNDHVRATHGGSTFDMLEEADRIKLVSALEQAAIDLPTVPTRNFFNTLFQLVMDGFFADPIYGGNRGKASWKLLGYPGVGEMYADKIAEWRNRPYRVAEPQSIQDLT